MCGIAGFAGAVRERDKGAMSALMEKMTVTMRLRGPDDSGVWVDAAAGIALGHRRLSILDLSPAGHQPMESGSGRYIITYNGEIYNFNDLRKELDSIGPRQWRGHSDTEVILAGIETWGIEKTLTRMNGMFAFGLWDREERKLILARDRIGKKPLYYGWSNGAFIFGSSLAPIRANGAFEGKIHRGAIALLLRRNYIPAPYSIYEGFYKLPPGCVLTLDEAGIAEKRLFNPFPERGPGHIGPERYWSVKGYFESGQRVEKEQSDEDIFNQLEIILTDSVAIRMISDVPLGAFLSGGIDSSLVVALMQNVSERPVKTFTIGFNEDQYNEAQHAKLVADHLKTDHTELYVTSEQAMDVIPLMPALYDEPFSDSSQIPTYLVSRLARERVTVALSGDGGDESFGGYNRYMWAQRIWRMIGWAPLGARKAAARAIESISPGGWDSAFGAFSFLLPRSLRYSTPGDKIHKAAALLTTDHPMGIYNRLVSHVGDPASYVIGADEPPDYHFRQDGWPKMDDFAQMMMYLDTVTYLPDDILHKVDRASMGVSLEVRGPLLDHRVVELAAGVSSSRKIRDGQGKGFLRKLLYKHVPRELIERPKMGFGVPVGDWMRGPLRPWAESLLDEKRIKREGYLQWAPIQKMWSEHLGAKRNWQYQLWNILMFQSWLEHNSK